MQKIVQLSVQMKKQKIATWDPVMVSLSKHFCIYVRDSSLHKKEF